jgi:hypothetical protein
MWLKQQKTFPPGIFHYIQYSIIFIDIKKKCVYGTYFFNIYHIFLLRSCITTLCMKSLRPINYVVAQWGMWWLTGGCGGSVGGCGGSVGGCGGSVGDVVAQ